MSSEAGLQEIYRILREWERDFPAGPDAALFAELKDSIRAFGTQSEIHLQKLAPYAEHLKPELTAQELFNIIVPFERALHKTVRDDEFLVREKDRGARAAYPLALVLENLRSAFNVGAFFRMAEALGAQEIVLSGYTPTPENEKVRKTTMGADAWLTWRSFPNSAAALAQLKSEGFRLVALETTAQALALTEPFLPGPTAFVFGNERFGIDHATLRAVDEIRHVPLVGQKNSLNVVSCGSIACFEWIRQCPQK